MNYEIVAQALELPDFEKLSATLRQTNFSVNKLQIQQMNFRKKNEIFLKFLELVKVIKITNLVITYSSFNQFQLQQLYRCVFGRKHIETLILCQVQGSNEFETNQFHIYEASRYPGILTLSQIPEGVYELNLDPTQPKHFFKGLLTQPSEHLHQIQHLTLTCEDERHIDLLTNFLLPSCCRSLRKLTLKLSGRNIALVKLFCDFIPTAKVEELDLSLPTYDNPCIQLVANKLAKKPDCKVHLKVFENEPAIKWSKLQNLMNNVVIRYPWRLRR